MRKSPHGHAVDVAGLAAGFLRTLLPFILAGVLAYTLIRKELGRHPAPRLSPRGEALAASAIGLALGLLRRLFRPGNGQLLRLPVRALAGLRLPQRLRIGQAANTATNLAALAPFAIKGHVWWHFALALAVANVGGSLIGTRLALKHGAGCVRAMFIAVVSALILKTGCDAFLR